MAVRGHIMIVENGDNRRETEAEAAASSQEAPAANDFYDIVLCLMPAVHRFPRDYRLVAGGLKI